jgi:SH3 domain-containing YSC84-like protein 1
MRAYFALPLCFVALPIFAETAQERLTDATQIVNEIMATPDKGIPQDLMEKAHCVVVVPGMKKASLGIGGKYGRGFATCRRAQGAQGGWGPPSAIRVEGGSFGFQLGVSSTDVVMLVMNERGMRRLLEDKFTLGANASVAAGPVGRTASAETDAQISAEILSWSRSKGLFAGLALEGATLRNDLDENAELYGEKLHSKDVLTSSRAIPAGAKTFVAALNKYSRFESANKPAETRAADAIKGEADRHDDKTRKRK